MSPDMRFPHLEASDLEGRWYHLPDDLPHGPRALVLGFRHMHHRQMSEWVRRLEELGEEHPAMTVWRLAPLPDGYRVMRDFIHGGMREGVADLEQRQRMLVSFTDLRSLADWLALRTMDAVYAYLLDSRGLVYWRGAGEVDETQLGTARNALQRLSSGS
jgi:hypothetical protein